MKKLVIGFTLMFVLLAMPLASADIIDNFFDLITGAATENETTCIDSDGGINYEVAGQACINGECTLEGCHSDGSLTEAYCEGDIVKTEGFICPSGCENGACLVQEVCPTIIGWRIENNKCVADTSCDYDASKYTYYDTEEICVKHLEAPPQCGGEIGCASEQKIYCEGSDTCSSVTNYKCIDGKCVASETTTVGCKPCAYGCSNGNCLSTPVVLPSEPAKPVPIVCAAKIKLSFEREIYYVEEEFKVVIEIFDTQGNHLPRYEFYTQIYDYDNGAWKNIGEDRTDDGGYTVHKERMKVDKPLQYGKNRFRAYTKEYSRCGVAEDIVTIEIRRREEPKPVPCGMGSCVPVPEPIVEPIDIPEERGFYSCQGCEKDGKCYPMGYRKEGQYCSDNYEFAAQIEAGECDNNFECKGNVCIGGECLTEGFIEKLIEWIRGIIGIEPKPPIEKACSKLLLEHNIGDYKYSESKYGEDEHTQVPLFSEDGQHLGIIKCCAAIYKDKENIDNGVLFCSYDNKEDATNSVKWIIAKVRNIIFKEYEGHKVFGNDKGRATIAWISNAYFIVVGAGPTQVNIPLPEDIADAYLKKYPSEFELTEDDIPDAPPEQPWIYCSEEDEKAGKECQDSGGALQTDPHPDKEKNCEVYKGCALHREACEEINNINDKENCYVKIAVKTGDISMCEKITYDASKKEKCIDLVGTQEPVIAEKEFLAEIENLGETNLIDFESLPGGTIPKNGDRITGKEWEGLGVTFEFPSENYLQLFGPMYPFNPLGKLSLSPGLGPFEAGGDTHDDLNIIFKEPVKAVGIYLMDLGETDERESITFLDENNNVIKRISPWPSPTFGNPAPGVFVSLIHDGIAKIEILENTQDSDDIAYDNLYFVR